MIASTLEMDLQSIYDADIETYCYLYQIAMYKSEKLSECNKDFPSTPSVPSMPRIKAPTFKTPTRKR